MQINYVDVGVLLILVIFGVRGGLRGFVAEVAGLVGLAVGLLIARAFYTEAANLLAYYMPREAASVVAFAVLVLLGMLVIGLLARLIQKVLEVAFANWLDKLLGIAAGIIKGGALCALVAYAAMIIFPQMPFIKESQTIPMLMDLVEQLVQTLHLNIPMPAEALIP